ncbi:hypothetical protein [Nocardioides sp. BYT-33-1]|uniref:hypothetical protein n=1 Tax=Nocardioides sp. BYT-33-1 TaxID=3416952 RepID=UPI003F53BFB3
MILRILGTLALACAGASVAVPAYAADTTPPTIHIIVPDSPGTGTWAGWYAAPVDIVMSATDDAGVTSLSYELTGAQTGTGDSTGTAITRRVGVEGVTTLTVRARDAAGNQAERLLGIGLDLTRPAVSIGGTVYGPPVERGQVRTFTYDCTDAVTAVVSCTARIGDAPFTSGGPVPTETTGLKTIVVTAIDAVGNRRESSNVYEVLDPFLEVTAPVGIVGDPVVVRVGQVLTVRPPTFAPAASDITYAWVAYRAGQSVSGDTFEVTPQYRGEELCVRATGTRPGYSPTRSSTHCGAGVPVLPGLHQVTGHPASTGRGIEGETLTVIPAAVSPTPQTVRTRWTVGGVQVSEEPGLRLTAAHVGQQIRCEQVYTSLGYDDAHAPCVFPGGATTATVTGHAWTVHTPAALKGKPKVGKKLRAILPVLSGPATTYAYQWLRNGKPIKGATRASYKLRRADARRKVTVRVTASTAHRADTVSVATPKRVRR